VDKDRLSSLSLFGSLSNRECRQIAQYADELELAEGTQLVREGEFAYEFFVIEDGTAEVMRAGEHVADLGPGDFMGEMGLVAHARRNASVVARSPMRCVVMSGQDFRTMERQLPDVAQRIQSVVEERSQALAG